MAHILSYLNQSEDDNVSFDPDMTHAMGLAFEAACARVADGSNPLLREVLAKAILTHAQRGERDPETLCRAALTAMGVDIDGDKTDKPG